LQPTAFGAGMRGAFCHQSLCLLGRVLPESAAAEPQAVMPPLGKPKPTRDNVKVNE